VTPGVRVRSKPEVSDASEKLEPLLPTGTELFVLSGPVAGSGYDWFEVRPLSTGLPHGGWVAATARDGEPWLVAGRPSCPAAPKDFATLAALTDGQKLACFSGVPITVRARLLPCNCDVDGPGMEPDWFFPSSRPMSQEDADRLGGGPLVLAQPGARAPLVNDLADFFLYLDPAGKHPSTLPIGEEVEVTVMFDHPAAAGCTEGENPGTGSPPPREPSSVCRFLFAVTDLT